MMNNEVDEIVGFNYALYHYRCKVCGEKVNWEANFDADGTSYHALCCDMFYTMRPYTVVIVSEKEKQS